ncbi:hypothetical protein [Mycobacterium sp. 20091114027_K0903767]
MTRRHYWIRHRWVDIVVPACAIGVWVVIAACGWAPWALTEVPADTRRALYQIMATIAATMGGVTLTSISLLVNLLRTPMNTVDHLLPASDKRRIGEAFLGVLPWLSLLFSGSLVGIATDATRAHGYRWLQLALMGLAMAAVCSIIRVVRILRLLLGAAVESHGGDGHLTDTATDRPM